MTTWNERLNFSLPQKAYSNAKLEIEVKDEDVISDNTVGVAWINLQNCRVFDGGRNTYEIVLHMD